MPVKIFLDLTVEEYIEAIEIYAPLYIVVMVFFTKMPEAPSRFLQERRKLHWFLQCFSLDPISLISTPEEFHRDAITECIHAYQNAIRFPIHN